MGTISYRRLSLTVAAALTAGALAVLAVGLVTAQPSVPHPTEGREQCTTCHQVGAPGVGEPGGTGLPSGHEGRTDAMCLGCHTVAAAATPTPEATATPTPTATPEATPTATPAPAPAPAGGGGLAASEGHVWWPWLGLGLGSVFLISSLALARRLRRG